MATQLTELAFPDALTSLEDAAKHIQGAALAMGATSARGLAMKVRSRVAYCRANEDNLNLFYKEVELTSAAADLEEATRLLGDA